MATYVYGLTYTDVQVPGVDASQISATSRVKTADVANFITSGAAQINAAMRAAGITASADMDADAHAAASNAVVSFAIWKIAYIMGQTTVSDEARRTWEKELGRVANAPRILGDAYTDGIVLEVDSIDTQVGDDWDFVGFGKKW